MTIETLLLLVVIILIAGAFPLWPHSKSWGYAPTGVLMLLLVVFLIWAIAGERPLFRSPARDLKTTIQDAGEDLKSTGRDVADSIRRTVE